MSEINISNGKLREIKESDLPRLVELSRNKEIMQHFFMIQDENEILNCWKEVMVRHARFSSLVEKRNLNHSMIITSNDLILGYLSLRGYELGRKLPNIRFDISYFVGEEYRGKGIATESVKSAIVYAFDSLYAKRVSATVNAENFPSIQVLKKAGFKQSPGSCTMRSVIDCRNGFLFGIDRSDFYGGNK
jgi:ribosomal-protein-alanine N-acetyltransferase